MSDTYREIKAHLDNTPLPAEIREVVSEALDSFAYSPPSKARLAEAVLRMPNRDAVEFAIRDAYEADVPVDQRSGEAADAVMRMFIDENGAVRS